MVEAIEYLNGVKTVGETVAVIGSAHAVGNLMSVIWEAYGLSYSL